MNVNDIRVGDKVRLVKYHPAHNPNLKRLVGAVGTVDTLGGTGALKYQVHVQFGDSWCWDHFWIDTKYLEPAGD